MLNWIFDGKTLWWLLKRNILQIHEINSNQCDAHQQQCERKQKKTATTTVTENRHSKWLMVTQNH